MKSPTHNNNKKLDGLITQAISRDKPEFDFDRWKQAHKEEFEVFRSQTAGKQTTQFVLLINIWRAIMKSRITKLAAAVVIVSVVVLTYCFYGELDGTSIAFGEVKNAVEKMQLVHKTLETNRDGKNYQTENWYYFDSRKILSKSSVEGNLFKISSLDYNTMEDVVYDPNSDVVTILYRTDVSSDPKYAPYSPWSLVEDYIKDFEQQSALVEHKKGKYEARDADIYNFSIPRNFRGEKVFVALTVDPDTHLPVICERRAWTQQGDLTLNQTITFDFPEDGPKDIYDMGVPKDTEVVYDADSKILSEKKNKLLSDKHVCEKQFYESQVYRLDEGQVLEYIPPSLVGPRIKIDQINEMLHQLENMSGQQDVNPGGEVNIADNYRLFYSDEKITSYNGPVFVDGVSLKEAFERIVGLSRFEYEIPDELIHLKIHGDWIARTGASKRQLLKAFEKIVQGYTRRPIRFEEYQIERNVLVVKGTFQFNPLLETYDDSVVHVFSDKMDFDERGGGGSDSLDKFLRYLGDIPLNQLVINETEASKDIKVRYGWHYSGYLSKIENEIERAERLQTILDNISLQTGLEFEQERRKVSKWIVTE